MNIYQKLAVATTGAALSLAVMEPYPCYAATITYDFTVNVTGGSLRGNSYNGSFSYDDSAASDASRFGYPNFGVTDFNFGFAGRTYTKSDLRYDCRYSVQYCGTNLSILGGERVVLPDGISALTPRGGTLSQIEFQNVGFRGFLNSTEQPLFQFRASPTDSFFNYQLPGESATFGSGNVTYSLGSTTPVPEPLTILGTGTAIGFGALMERQYSRKRKKTKQTY